MPKENFPRFEDALSKARKGVPEIRREQQQANAHAKVEEARQAQILARNNAELQRNNQIRRQVLDAKSVVYAGLIRAKAPRDTRVYSFEAEMRAKRMRPINRSMDAAAHGEVRIAKWRKNLASQRIAGYLNANAVPPWDMWRSLTYTSRDEFGGPDFYSGSLVLGVDKKIYRLRESAPTYVEGLEGASEIVIKGQGETEISHLESVQQGLANLVARFNLKL